MPNGNGNGNGNCTRLDSWKDIASYLRRDVRTVIRWEKEKGLPVRRVPGGRRQAVFAYTAELESWLRPEDSNEFGLVQGLRDGSRLLPYAGTEVLPAQGSTDETADDSSARPTIASHWTRATSF